MLLQAIAGIYEVLNLLGAKAKELEDIRMGLGGIDGLIGLI